MKGRIKRKLVWNNKGVSEIIGTILMLAITVVMFSSIIAWVGKIPPPRESFHVELDIWIEPAVPSDWGLGTNFTMRHQGGQEMDQYFVKVYLTVDNTPLSFDVPDGLTDSDGNSNWGLGETWSQNITKGIGPGQVPTLSGPTNPSTFSVMVVNVEKNTIIWQETLGEGVNKFAPIIIDTWIDSDLGTPNVLDPGPISYTDPFKVYARVVDPEGFDPDYGLDETNIWVNLSWVYNDDTLPPVQLLDTWDAFDAVNDDVYVAQLDPPTIDEATPGNYWFKFNASDLTQPTSMTIEKLKLFPVGMIVGDNPQIEVLEIAFSDPEPVNGDTISISATIRNKGGAGALVDVWFYDGDNTTSALIGQNNVSIAAQGEVISEMTWLATPGGVHMIRVDAMVNDTYAADHNIFDPYLPDNYGFENLTVMPKILLVDDDSELNDRGPKDTVSFMRASLEAADYEYDFTIVGAGDGPGYDYGDYPLMDYDVVIWMTGYQTINTLTENPFTDTDDLDNLQKYLDAGNGTGNGGSLWLVSQGFFAEAAGDVDLQNFATNYLQVPSATPIPVAALPLELYGNATHPGHPVTDDFADYPIMTTSRASGAIYERSYYWDVGTMPIGTMALNSSDQCYAASYDSDNDTFNPVIDSRIYVQPWDFSRIEDTATQAQYTYKVIKWLGNITTKYTKDVAISEQTVSPSIVFYKQQVTIKFIVRNNGFENYTLQDDLYYRLRILDIDGNELQPPVLVYEQVDFLGFGKNNTRVYYYNWTPQEIGFHRLQIKVDPDNRITESNEWNNEISNYLSSGELFVQYRILIVDDDNSFNNNGVVAGLDETAEITDALNFLNATGKYSYEQFVVDETAGGFGPSYDAGTVSLNKYNAVFWITGEDGSGVGGYSNEALKTTDQQNISDYLDHGGNIWIIGNGLWTMIDPSVNIFEQNYLRINSVGGDAGTVAAYRGVRDDPVSHGMNFPGAADANADLLIPEPIGLRPPGEGFFYQDDAMTAFNSIRYEGPTPTNVTTYRAATSAWLLSSLNENTSKAELVFMMLRWFDKPEDRSEARVTDMDIWLSDEHPQLGSGYVIQATIHNTGGALANVLVRFMDGSTQIGSDSISVSPDGTTTAEIIWIPLFAGQRTLNVLLDPIAEVDEIFEWSNNNATKDTYVYFFWDDMESGSGKWDHSATILLINGEEPLEYFYDTELDTNIITEWNATMSSPELTTCEDDDFYHSHDKSYWLQEPGGESSQTTRIPVDVVFALDSSGSMDGARMANQKTAVNLFLGYLSPDDRAAIWCFSEGDGWEVVRPYLYEGYLSCTPGNVAYLQTQVNALWDNGHTVFYDTVGEATQYAIDNAAPPGSQLTDDRYEFVIALTDGHSNSDDEYTPGNFPVGLDWGMSGPESTHDPRDYNEDDTASTMWGLINSPVKTYTIGLQTDHDPAYPDNEASQTPPDTAFEEYDLWHVANSSNTYGLVNETTGQPLYGEYYYCTDPALLPDIFTSIFSSIEQTQLTGENQTRSAPPMPEPKVLVWSDGFESNGFANWDNNPNDWTVRDVGENDYGGQTVNAVAEGNRCANTHDNNGNWDELRKSFGDLSAYANRTVTFYYHVQDCENGEDIYVQIWHDGGWDTVVNLQDNNGQSTTDPGDWSLYTIDLETDITVTDWTDIRLRFNIDSALENADEFMLDDVQLNADVAVDIFPPYIVTTNPADGDIDVLVNQNIIITFNEAMNPTTFAYSVVPDPGGWGEVWSGGDTIVTLGHTDFIQSQIYIVTVTACEDVAGNPLATYTLIISTDFESGTFEGWATAGNNDWDWSIVTDRARGTYSAKGGRDGSCWMTYNDFDMSTSVNTELSFYTQSINTENGEDDLEVRVSTNDWGSYNTLLSIDGDTVLENGASNWHYYLLDMSAYDGQPDVDVRFYVDPDNDNEFYWVDDILIEAGGAPNPWSFTTTGPPFITATNPAAGAINVMLNQDVIIDFSKPMNTGSLLYTCTNDPGGWAEVWSAGNTRVTLSHNFFAPSTPHTFEVTQANDGVLGIVAGPVPNPWTFTTASDDPPWIVSTVPANGAIGIPVNQDIVITFSEAMSIGTVTFSCAPNPGGWPAPINPPPAASWSAGDTVLTLTHANFQQGMTYTVTIADTSEDLTGNNLTASAIPNPWSFLTIDTTPPHIISVTPSDGSTGVGAGQSVVIQFDEAMNQGITEAAFACSPDPGGWSFEWNAPGTELTAHHYVFDFSKIYNCFVTTAARDISGNTLDGDQDGTSEGSPTDDYTWSFTTGTTGGGSGIGISPPGQNSNKTAVTETMNLQDLENAKLSFWHKYNMMPGANGGFLQIGYNITNNWVWRYVIPANAYTGNLRASTWVNDSFGQRIYWCWNGVSGGGTFDWDYVSVDLLNYVPDTYRDEVRIKFNYTQYGGGTGYGWYIDDVRVTASRANVDWPENNTAVQDIWNLTNADARSGNYSWSNVDPVDGLKPGIDNYIRTTPIDLTNARSAYLSAYFKFNLNEASGAPPDGFRVEVSKDGGVSWIPINFGVRSSWGVSGTGNDIEDGTVDGKAYTGLSDSGDPIADDFWVNATSLSRVNVDLSSFSGNAIQIRFRMVTCGHIAYTHNNNANYGSDPGFGGFYMDDVLVFGETILTG